MPLFRHLCSYNRVTSFLYFTLRLIFRIPYEMLTRIEISGSQVNCCSVPEWAIRQNYLSLLKYVPNSCIIISLIRIEIFGTGHCSGCANNQCGAFFNVCNRLTSFIICDEEHSAEHMQPKTTHRISPEPHVRSSLL